MAGDNIEKKVLVEFELANKDAQAQMSSLATAVDEVAKSVKDLQNITKTSQTALTDYAEKLAQSKLSAQQNREEITRLNLERRKEKDAIDKAKNSLTVANGSYDEAQKKLTALGRAIKSAEGGFRSTDPAIKAQIAEYRKLNDELKKFDAQLGNHQRNVGNYEGALEKVSSTLDRIIPGFGQFQGILKGAAQGFNALKGSTAQANSELANTAGAAGTAEEGVGALGGAMGGLIIAGAAVIGMFAAIAKHFADLTPNADALGQRFAYLKGLFRGFVDDIGQGVGFGKLAQDMRETAQEAANLKMKLQDLNRAQAQDLVDDAKADAKIAELQLKMRNRRNTVEQERQYFNQIQKISQDKHDGNKKLADEEYELAVRTATNSKRFTDQEISDLRRLGVEYAIQLDKRKGLVNGEDDIKAIVAAQQKQIATDREREMIAERAQNRLDAMELKGEQAAEKERQELAKIKQGMEEAQSERIASIVRTLDFQREAFAKELSDADEHYRQLIFKQRKFIEQMQVIATSPKSTPKEKTAAKKAISAGQDTIAQLQKEQYANQEKLLEDHSKAMLAETQKAGNDLKQLQIESIDDQQERERQAEELRYKEQNEALSKEGQLLNENQAKLIAEIKTATGERKSILEKELEDTQELIEAANSKRRELQLQHQRNDLDRDKKFATQKKVIQDEINLISDRKSGAIKSPFSKKAERDEIQLIKDQEQQELQKEGLEGKKNKDGSDFSELQLLQKEKIIDESEARIDEIKKQHVKERMAFELQIAQSISNGAFTILQQSIARNAQAQDVALQKQKSHDLQNTALTATQKYIIDEKYRIREGQAKVKQFKQEQKINIAKALIDGYLGIQKSLAEWGMPFAIPFIAATGVETSLQVAAIAAQKPPAYALGGQFVSDGRGAVLPGYSRHDNVNATLRSGEAVVVSEAMRDPWAKSIVSAINQAYGGRAFDSTVSVPKFAAGGVFNNYLPTGDNGLRPQINVSAGNGRMHPDDITGIAKAVASMPTPVMDIKDVNYAQGRLAQAYDRLSY